MEERGFPQYRIEMLQCLINHTKIIINNCSKLTTEISINQCVLQNFSRCWQCVYWWSHQRCKKQRLHSVVKMNHNKYENNSNLCRQSVKYVTIIYSQTRVITTCTIWKYQNGNHGDGWKLPCQMEKSFSLCGDVSYCSQHSLGIRFSDILYSDHFVLQSFTNRFHLGL